MAILEEKRIAHAWPNLLSKSLLENENEDRNTPTE
jgi:hypothetical protein